MLVGDIAEPYPVVGVDTSAFVAAQLLAKDRLPGLVVVEADGTPKAVLPASQVVRFMVPEYVQNDPSLARVIGERAADRIAERLRQATVGELLPERLLELPVLKVDDTVLELAAVMARLRSPLCAVVDGNKIIGVITASHLIQIVCETLI
jgi:predicted transcriptional regulator